MSGRKCSNITISQRRYDSMLSNMRRSDNAAANAERRARAARKSFDKLNRTVVQNQKRMQAEYRDGLNMLSQSVRDSENRQGQRLEDLRFDIQQDMEQQRQQFKAALDAQRQETNAALQTIRNDIQADKDAQASHAQTQINDLEGLVRLFRADDAQARFAPGELDEIEARLELARNNFETGQFQAALAAGQERYFEYQSLRTKVAERKAEWTAYFEELQNQVAELCGDANAAKEAEYSFADPDKVQEVDVVADVDFWSDGEFSVLSEKIDAVNEKLLDPDTLSTDALKSLAHEVEMLKRQLDEVIQTAKTALVQSQLRRELAENVLASFADTQWEIDDSLYENQDFRRAIHCKLKNPLGEEIVVSVKPIQTEAGLDAEVEINFFDKSNDERMRAARLSAINEQLSEGDFKPGAFQCLDDSQNRPGLSEMLDFDSLGAERKVRSRDTVGDER